MKILNLENVSKFYKSAETVSVGMKNVSASFEIGEFVAITGESGSGKSTLLNVISGLDGYEEGELYHYGEETSHYTISDWETYRSAYIGFVFQNYNIIDSYTVYQNVMFALEIQGYPREKRKKRALELIKRVGLLSHKNHKASKLSGGQKQRTVLARALAKDTPIIVADEPTGNLDSASAKQVMALLHELSKEKLVIVVTHDYSQVEKYATRKIRMHDGFIVEDIKLNKYPKKEEQIKLEVKKVPFLTLLRISFRNIFSTPKRTLFMLVLQILVIGLFTIMYSGQVQTLRETGLQSSMAYPRVPETRLLVERRDNLNFTESEIETFNKNRNTLAVYKNSHLFYNDKHIMFDIVNGSRGYNIDKTDSAVVLKENEIKGRLPVEKNEVVISEYYDSVNIGDVIGLSFGNYYFYETDANYFAEFEVVGIDKMQRNTIYFSEAYLNQEIEFDEVDEVVYNYAKETLNRNFRVIINGVSYQASYDENINLDYDVQMVKNNTNESFTTLNDVDVILETVYNYQYYTRMEEIESFGMLNGASEVYVSKDIYEMFILGVLDNLSNQYTIDNNLITVSVASYSYGDNFMESIDQEIYKVYYPANINSPFQAVLLFLQTLISGVLLFFVGMFLYAIVHAVSKNVMKARKKDFAVFRSIGTNQKMLAKMVVIEQVITNMIGFFITLFVLFLMRNNINFIAASLPYMRVRDYIILGFIFLFFGVWLGLRFNKKVFNQSVIEVLTSSKGEF